MHSRQWQSVCGFLTDGCESLEETGRTMRELFDAITARDRLPVYGWYSGEKRARCSSLELRRRVIAAAKKLLKMLPGNDRPIGLHLENRPSWPVLYWAILMSGNIPLIMDPRRELFHYRELPGIREIYTITEDKEYPRILSPRDVLDGSEGIDAGFFDDKWADMTYLAVEREEGGPVCACYGGADVCGQILRMRRVYRESVNLLYPRSAGPVRLVQTIPFAEALGFFAGMIVFPYFGAEVIIPSSASLKGALKSCIGMGATHLLTEPDRLEEIWGEDGIGGIGVRDEYLDWLSGRSPTSDFRKITRYNSLSVKVRKRLFGRKARMILTAEKHAETRTRVMLRNLGLSFCCAASDGVFGLTEMTVDDFGDVPERKLLSGVTESVSEDGKQLLSGEGHAKGILTEAGIRELPVPWSTGRRARTDGLGRIRLEEEQASEETAVSGELIGKLRLLYADVLNLPEENLLPDADFFRDYGGDSLTYFMLLERMEVAFGVRLTDEEKTYMNSVIHAAKALSKYVK